MADLAIIGLKIDTQGFDQSVDKVISGLKRVEEAQKRAASAAANVASGKGGRGTSGGSTDAIAAQYKAAIQIAEDASRRQSTITKAALRNEELSRQQAHQRILEAQRNALEARLRLTEHYIAKERRALALAAPGSEQALRSSVRLTGYEARRDVLQAQKESLPATVLSGLGKAKTGGADVLGAEYKASVKIAEEAAQRHTQIIRAALRDEEMTRQQAHQRITAFQREALAARLQLTEHYINRELEVLSRTQKGSKAESRVLSRIAGLQGEKAQIENRLENLDASVHASLPRAQAGVSRLGHAFQQLNKTMALVRNTFVSLYIAKSILEEIARPITALIDRGLKFNQTMETARLGIASLIAATNEFRTSDGIKLTGIEEFQAAIPLAEEQLRHLRMEALQTTATFQELITAFQQSVASGSTAGLSLDQTRRLSVQITQAAKTLGLPGNQLAEEVRSLLAGTINARNTRVATALGITNKDVERAKSIHQLFNMISEKLEPFAAAGREVALSFEGMKSNLEDALDILSGAVSKDLFADLKGTLSDIFKEVFDPGSLSGVKSTFQPLVDAANELGGALGDILRDTARGLIDWARDLSNALRDNPRAVKDFADALRDAAALAGLLLGMFRDLSGVLSSKTALPFGGWKQDLKDIGLLLSIIADLYVDGIYDPLNKIVATVNYWYLRSLQLTDSSAALAQKVEEAEKWTEEARRRVQDSWSYTRQWKEQMSGVADEAARAAKNIKQAASYSFGGTVTGGTFGADRLKHLRPEEMAVLHPPNKLAIPGEGLLTDEQKERIYSYGLTVTGNPPPPKETKGGSKRKGPSREDLLRAREDLKIAELETEFERFRQVQEGFLEDLKEGRRQELIDVDNFLTQRLGLQRENLRKEEELEYARLAILERRQSATKPGSIEYLREGEAIVRQLRTIDSLAIKQEDAVRENTVGRRDATLDILERAADNLKKEREANERAGDRFERAITRGNRLALDRARDRTRAADEAAELAQVSIERRRDRGEITTARAKELSILEAQNQALQQIAAREAEIKRIGISAGSDGTDRIARLKREIVELQRVFDRPDLAGAFFQTLFEQIETAEDHIRRFADSLRGSIEGAFDDLLSGSRGFFESLLDGIGSALRRLASQISTNILLDSLKKLGLGGQGNNSVFGKILQQIGGLASGQVSIFGGGKTKGGAAGAAGATASDIVSETQDAIIAKATTSTSVTATAILNELRLQTQLMKATDLSAVQTAENTSTLVEAAASTGGGGGFWGGLASSALGGALGAAGGALGGLFGGLFDNEWGGGYREPADDHYVTRRGQRIRRKTRAWGGDAWAGEGYMVGENGPEYFFPATNGYFHQPKNGGGMGATITANFTIVANNPQEFNSPRSRAQMAQQVHSLWQEAIRDKGGR